MYVLCTVRTIHLYHLNPVLHNHRNQEVDEVGGGLEEGLNDGPAEATSPENGWR